jgi:hypothetical protein
MPGMSGGAGPALSRRPLAPLALTLGLHLLLGLAWMQGASHGLQREAPEAASTFVLVEPTPASRPKPAASLAIPRPRMPLPVLVLVPAPLPAPAPAASETSEALEAATPAEAPAPTLPGELLASSKRMAGGVDRALGKGSSPVTAESERKWERFAAAFAGARTSIGRDTILDSHTAADGVTIYRKTVGDRVACYRSGSVGGLGPADGQSAGKMPCPTGVSWTRH